MQAHLKETWVYVDLKYILKKCYGDEAPSLLPSKDDSTLFRDGFGLKAVTMSTNKISSGFDIETTLEGQIHVYIIQGYLGVTCMKKRIFHHLLKIRTKLINWAPEQNLRGSPTIPSISYQSASEYLRELSLRGNIRQKSVPRVALLPFVGMEFYRRRGRVVGVPRSLHFPSDELQRKSTNCIY
ncbi:hypothetical protein NC651_027928 [Populus alba x Populus x berolinensis]|nr:hypothetical protein NC651_027928 [Populus alba x Populus x berolinensis]